MLLPTEATVENFACENTNMDLWPYKIVKSFIDVLQLGEPWYPLRHCIRRCDANCCNPTIFDPTLDW